MIHPYIVYKITSPTGHIYIGVTKNRKERWGKYAGGRCRSQPVLYRSILKYGWANHKVEIIIEGLSSKEKAFEHERRLIAEHRTRGDTLLNVSAGGECGPVHKGRDNYLSKPVLQFTLDGKFVQEWESGCMAAAGIGKPNQQTCANRACRTRGRAHGFYWLWKTDYEAGVRPGPKPSRRKHRPIVQLTLDGGYVAQFDNVSDAAETVYGSIRGCPNIRLCLEGKRMSANGFRWVEKATYSNGDYSFEDVKPWYRTRKIEVVDSKGSVVACYPSLKQAAAAYNTSSRTVLNHCLGYTKKARHDWRFRYAS